MSAKENKPIKVKVKKVKVNNTFRNKIIKNYLKSLRKKFISNGKIYLDKLCTITMVNDEYFIDFDEELIKEMYKNK